MTPTSRIAVVREFGPPEVIKIETHPVVELQQGQIRVAVRTGGLNPVDARRRAGNFGGSVPMVLGTEFAGIVQESKDSNWKTGDEVIGWGAQGADADLVTTDGTRIARKPASLHWAIAGGLSGVGQTALTALNALNLKKGDLLIVHGASGGVGSILVQLAVARGYKIIGTASDANQQYLKSLGATPVLYGADLDKKITDAANGQAISASIDLAGTKEAGDVAVKIKSAGGQAITLVPETIQSHGLQLVSVRHSHAQLQELLDGVASGKIQFTVDTLPFTQIVEAHRRLDEKHAQGKLVLDLSDNPHLQNLIK